MAKGKGGGSAKSKVQNDDRRCKKAWKKHPGVSPQAHSGKSNDGYSLKPELVAERERRKAAAAARYFARTNVA